MTPWQRRIPWLVGAAALVFYLVTLVKWGTVAGLPTTAKITGWEWKPSFHAPLHFLLTLPISWLPGTWQLTASNAFATLCSALTLGLLARSVCLLPHDRTKHQRQLERSDYSLLSLPTNWLPPLFAVVVCGLQFSFWEHSIVITGEALDVLLFAFVVWTLLEYRLDERNARLYLGAFVYGLGITNNYAMIPFLPAFLVALVWIKGFPVLNGGFIVRLLASGLGGLLLYFLLPALAVKSGLTHLGFWESLLVNFSFQKDVLVSFPRYVILIIGLTSLVPILFIGIRWPAQFGDINPAGAKLTDLMTHIIHAALFAAIIYVAFDPPFSPRKLGAGRAFLPFYFLGALSVGYFSGYFLLICGAKPVKSWERPSALGRLVQKLVLALVYASVVVLPVLLFLRNQPQLAKINGKELHVYAQDLAHSLPDDPATLLSDDPTRLLALAAVLSRDRPDHPYILVDTASLRFPAYHRYLHRKYPDRWPSTFINQPLLQGVPDVGLLELFTQIETNQPLFYAHPSFGFYFEKFYAVPRQLALELKRLPARSIEPPVLTPEIIATTDQFWKAYDSRVLKPLQAQVPKGPPSDTDQVLISYIASSYASVLNWVGCEIQRAGQIELAGDYFRRATELNPQNPIAAVNDDFNQLLQAGQPPRSAPSKTVTELMEPYAGDWNRILGMNGPPDEPNFCFLLAQSFTRGNNHIQAGQKLLRTLAFLPDFIPAKLSLAAVHVQLNRGKDALQLLAEISASTNLAQLPVNAQLSYLQAEAWAHVTLDDLPRAAALLENAQEKFPEENLPYSIEANIYWTRGDQTNAMAVYQKQLTRQTNSVGARINLSAFKIHLGQYQEAVDLMDQALTIAPSNLGALLNRAIAHLNLNHNAEARRDYQAILAASTKPVASAHFGLGEIAWREKDYKNARRHYETFLKYAPQNSQEYQRISQRVESIKDGTM